MALGRLIRCFGASLSIITIEDALELSDGHPRALVGNGQMGEAIVTGQVNQYLTSRRSERNGIVDQVFGDAFNYLLGAEYEELGTRSADMVRS